MVEFSRTRAGIKLLDETLPSIANKLETIGKQMTRANELKEEEVKLKEQEVAAIENQNKILNRIERKMSNGKY